MIFGEYDIQFGDIEFNVGCCIFVLSVVNIGDWLIQVGLYYYFFEVNDVFVFDCLVICGMCLNIVVGIVVCFELGQSCEVELVEIGGGWWVYGFVGWVMGDFQGFIGQV